MPTYILISHFIWLLQWFIILDMNNLVKVSHHYCMALKLSIKLKSTWTAIQTREVQQGIPRNLGTNPYMSPYVEQVSCGEFFLTEILQKSSQGPTKVHFFIKASNGRNGDHDDLEWPMLSYYVIYCEKFRKVLQRTEKVALSSLCQTHGYKVYHFTNFLFFVPLTID